MFKKLFQRKNNFQNILEIYFLFFIYAFIIVRQSKSILFSGMSEKRLQENERYFAYLICIFAFDYSSFFYLDILYVSETLILNFMHIELF